MKLPCHEACCRSLPKIGNLLRHGKSPQHRAAVRQLNDSCESGELAETAGPSMSLSYAHVLFQRVLVASGGSFFGFARWLRIARIAGADILGGAEQGKVSKQLADVMADKERDVTQKILRAADVCCLKQDGKASKVVLNVKSVVWRWPTGLKRDPWPAGVVSLSGANGPWIAHRIGGLSELRRSHGPEALSQSIEDKLAEHCHNAEEVAALKAKCIFFTSDGAASEVASGCLLGAKFVEQDESHSAMLVLKDCIGADPEVALVDRLLVSGTENPRSAAKLLSTSDRFSAIFQDEEQQDAVQVLQHFGWSMPRFSSRKKPTARTARRLQQLFACLAQESEEPKSRFKDDAIALIEGLSGDNSMRLVLGGMMADLYWSTCDGFVLAMGMTLESLKLRWLWELSCPGCRCCTRKV